MQRVLKNSSKYVDISVRNCIIFTALEVLRGCGWASDQCAQHIGFV